MKTKGYIALTTVLVILPLLLLTGIDSLYKNTTALIVGKMNHDYQILKSNTETCLEETVYKIKRNRSYTGTYTIAMDSWSCEITVSNKEETPGVKIIVITATDTNGASYESSKELNVNTDPFELTNI